MRANFLTIAIFISLAATSHAGGITHYVSTHGNDNNNGALGTPWRTIQHAANSVQAGDIVYVRSGIYREAVTLSASGSASAGTITFSSYPGEVAIIDGTGLKVVNRQSGLVNITDRSYVVINGFEIRNFTSSSDGNVPIGIYVKGAGSYIQLLNNHVHAITTNAPANPTNCASNAFGIAVYGTRAPEPIDHLTIADNEVDHLRTGCSETVTINGNVTNFLVSNNKVHDNNNIGIAAIGFEGTSPELAYDQARAGLITGNLVYNITSYGNPDYGKQYAADGIYVDGGTNIVIERNTVHNADLNIELASEHRGRLTSYVTVRNNLLYNGNSAGISIGGYDNLRGGTAHCNIVNNTLYNNDTEHTGSGEFQVQYYATNNIFKNNILYANSQNLFLNYNNASEAAPAALDYNLFFSSDASNATWNWGNIAYVGFGSYKSGTNLDHNSIFANPEWTSLTIPSFNLQPSSPAINTGISLGAAVVGTLDFPGNPRISGKLISIGAYEK